MADSAVFSSSSLSAQSGLASLVARARATGRVPGFAWADRHGHWALRLPLAAMLLFYGLQKFPDALIQPGAFGVPAVLFVLAAFGEVLGAAALVIGGIVETWRPKSGWMRLTGDVITRSGAFAGAAATAGVIGFFYLGAISITDPHIMQLSLALFLLVRGNKYQQVAA